MPPAIVDLDVRHLASVQFLLESSGLPFEDCAEHIDNFVGVFEEHELIAFGGIEVLNGKGLLRSVVVREGSRAQGLAAVIINRLHEKARIDGVQDIYLLTETAQCYFEKLGYQSVPRVDLPEEVKTTQQFLSLCPDSAHAMHIHLTAQPCQ